MMKELEEMICTIGSDAINHQMQVYQEDEHGNLIKPFGQHGHNDERRQKELKLREEKERLELEAESKKREEMMKEWSDRDKTKLTEVKDTFANKIENLKKEFGKDLIASR